MDYAAFIFFYPTMVAGPIKRYQEFVPKLTAARFDPDLVSRGVTRILVGLAKKHAAGRHLHRLVRPAQYRSPV